MMYGMFLLPLFKAYREEKHKFKLLDIGLGCQTNHGPGINMNNLVVPPIYILFDFLI